MADKIRGITVELSADVSKMVKGINSINENLKATTKDLKDVNKALKLDPSNTELLKQKQDLLTSAIEDTEKKLGSLKEAQAQAAKEMETGNEKAKQAYDLLAREVSACQVSLDKLKDEALKTDSALVQPMKTLQEGFEKVGEKIGKAGEKVSAFGDGISNLGSKVSVASAAVVALGTAAVEAFKEVDAGADTVITKTGATGVQAELLNETFEELTSTMITSFDEAGAAIGEINTRYGYTGDKLKTLSEQFIKFANINGQDVESAIIGVDHAMKMFNIDGEETSNVLGLITSVGQRTGISVATLESSLQSNGATLQEMGLGIAESVELMGALEQSGADANTVLASMKKAASECAKKNKDFSTVLQDLIGRLQKSDTVAEATAETFDIFGTRAGLSFVNLAKQGKISLNGLNKDLSKYSGVVDTTYEATLDGLDQVTLVTNKTKLALSRFGQTISDGVVPFIDKLNDVIEDLTDWIDELDQSEKEQIVKIGLIIAALGPAILIAGKIVKVVGLLVTKVGTLAATIGSLINPVTVTIAAITALGVAVGIAADKMEDAQLAEYGWDEEAKEFNKTIKEQSETLSEVNEERKRATDEVLDETGKVEALYGQLRNIVKINGEIKEGYETQAGIIAEKLSYYLNEEITIVDGQVQKWKELGHTVLEVMRNKKLALLTDANEEAYLEALTKQEGAYHDLQTASKAYQDQIDKVAEAEKKWRDLEAEYIKSGMASTTMGQIEIGELESEYITAKEALDNLYGTYETAKRNYGEYTATIEAYEAAISASTTGLTEDIDAAVQKLIDLANYGEDEWCQFVDSIPASMKQAVENLKPLVDKFRTGFYEPVANMFAEIERQIAAASPTFSGSGNGGSLTVTSNVVLDGNVVGSTANQFLGNSVGYWLGVKK